MQESDELYLLTSNERANVKVRDDLMDIKALVEVEQGLEQWRPVMKAAFPITAEQVRATLAALDLPAPQLTRDGYTLQQFLDEVGEPAGIRGVAVHKRRLRYVVNGCTSEVTELTVDGKPLRTIAIESEDAGAVREGVRAMGLEGYRNTSYPPALRDVVRDAPARYAVVDVGTNSVKFHLAERTPDGRWRTLVDRAAVTRLGEDLQVNGTIVPAALDRTADAIAEMAAEARQHGVRAIAAVGTEGLRQAKNNAAVVAEIARRSGVTVEVISGEQESRLAYLAVQGGLGLGDVPLVVFDTGGGSSQFTFGHGARVDERYSVPVGAVRYTERFGLDRAVTPQVLDAAQAAIAADLHSLDARPAVGALIAMGGAITNMTAVMHGLAEYDPEVVQGSRLTRSEVERQIALYASMDADARRAIVGLQPKRAEVMLAGACIVRTVMDKLAQQAATVSDRGLRHGTLAERFGDAA